ncbi:MAG TPA: metallophosphoesterase [Povalibacter sp.]
MLSFVALRCVAAPLTDGPYVTSQADGAWLARRISGEESAPKVIEQHVTTRRPVIAVSAVGAVPEFKVRLRPPASVAPDEVSLPTTTSLFVVADTHGEYEILVQLLRSQRIVDESLRWSFGRGHLVFLGDVFDRGLNQIEILWLIYELEAQAAKAGGGVHFVLGNHETMVMGGDLRYLNPKYSRVTQALGAASYSELLGPNTLLGQWLRTRPTVLRIRDLLCLHGGISREVTQRGLTLRQINTTVRDVLSGTPLDPASREHAGLLLGELGPLWYRGYFGDSQHAVRETPDQIGSTLRHFGVSTILVGHTRVPTVTSLYDQRVIAVHVYPQRDDTSGQAVMEAVKVESGRFLRARIDGTTEPLATGH